ncbi:uncharacterized protein [Solanum lycopersicum]|uniref:uncharacterized protein n=1 Tax=Solanum lycopersicum TaxID=4081 RepID=UPI0002BC8194|nr:uncharacterized protein LOC101264950 [Solanum lycopersicum]
MSNLSKLEFVALDISEKNYLSWVLAAEIHLVAKGLDATITQGNEASSQDKAKVMIFIRHHLNEGLKIEYLMVKDPLELWIDLKGRYDHLKATVLQSTRYEWNHLQFQDFKTQQHREKDFQKYSELILCLLVVEKHNALLMKNHEARPTRAAPLRRQMWWKKRNKSGASSSNARAESHMTLTNDDKPETSQKYDKELKQNWL